MRMLFNLIKYVLLLFCSLCIFLLFTYSATPELRDDLPSKQLKKITNDWVTTSDGKLSFRIIPEFEDLDKTQNMVLIGELRNNTPNTVYVLRPFGDQFASAASMRIQGPKGEIKYIGLTMDYILGSGAYDQIKSNGVLLDRMILNSSNYNDINLPGEYKIQYIYRGFAAKPENINETIWQGTIESNPIVITRI
jgi:hypothetical protein